jgi:hypothetical protein
MNTATWSVVGVCLMMTVGCGRTEERAALEEPATVQDEGSNAPARAMTVDGCLTAAGDRFVLTQLDKGVNGAEPGTESYRLVGMEEQLRPLVGQHVEVTGTAEAEQVVDIRESSPPPASSEEPRGTTGATPQVSTVQSTQLAVSDLRVSSVRGRGDQCPTSR